MKVVSKVVPIGNPKAHWDCAEWTLDADDMWVKVVPGDLLFEICPRARLWCQQNAEFRSASGSAIVRVPSDEVGDLFKLGVPGELALVLVESARKNFTHVCLSSVFDVPTRA